MVVIQITGGEGSQGLTVQAVRRGGAGLDDVALVQLKLNFAGHILLSAGNESLNSLTQRGEPLAFVYDLSKLVAHVLLGLHGGAV